MFPEINIQITPGDSPNHGLKETEDTGYVQSGARDADPREQETFCTYFVFSPDERDAAERIWVPLHRMTWSWAARAIDDQNPGWDVNDHKQLWDISPNPVFDIPTSLPEWIENSETYTQDETKWKNYP